MSSKDYLTEDFIKFSKEIEELYNKKKLLEEEMEKSYKEFKIAVAALEEQVKAALDRWESRKNKIQE